MSAGLSLTLDILSLAAGKSGGDCKMSCNATKTVKLKDHVTDTPHWKQIYKCQLKQFRKIKATHEPYVASVSKGNLP